MWIMPIIQYIILFLFPFLAAVISIASKAELNENHINNPELLAANGLNWAIIVPTTKIMILIVHKIDTL